MRPVTSLLVGLVVGLSRLDLDEIAQALSDGTDDERRWLINPDTGEILFWTSDTGIDGHTPVDLDELDELPIDPLPSHVWYQDMADFARVSRKACQSGSRSGNSRARNRAVTWLADNALIDHDTATRYHTEHPDSL